MSIYCKWLGVFQFRFINLICFQGKEILNVLHNKKLQTFDPNIEIKVKLYSPFKDIESGKFNE